MENLFEGVDDGLLIPIVLMIEIAYGALFDCAHQC